MNLVVIACARDEIDIIEPFVRQALAVASRVVVLDNGSTDGTRDVLASLEREGLPIDIVDDPSPGKYLSARLTRLMHDYAVARYDADWVLPLDVDEFVDRGLARALAGEATDGAPVLLPWRSYVPREDDDSAQVNPVLRIRHRLAGERDTLSKIVVPGDLARRPGAVIVQGSHAIEIDGRGAPARRVAGHTLAHFPVRAVGQFLAKTVIGHLQNEVMPFRESSSGWHHRTHYELLKSNPDAFVAGLPQMAERYSRVATDGEQLRLVHDPLQYCGGPLRYTPDAFDALGAWKPVLRYTQELARRHALLSGSLSEAENASAEEQHRVHAFLINQLVERDRSMLLLNADNGRLKADLDLLRSSWTWRTGTLVMSPVRWCRSIWRAIPRKGPAP